MPEIGAVRSAMNVSDEPFTVLIAVCAFPARSVACAVIVYKCVSVRVFESGRLASVYVQLVWKIVATRFTNDGLEKALPVQYLPARLLSRSWIVTVEMCTAPGSLASAIVPLRTD